MSRIFMDASCMVPMVIRSDQWRPRLDAVMSRLPRKVELVTSNWTLYEALALSQRRGKAFARGLFELMSERGTIMPVTEQVEREALRRFLAWTDKFASVTDHANVLVAVGAGCDAVVSFDEDFIPIARSGGIQLLA